MPVSTAASLMRRASWSAARSATISRPGRPCSASKPTTISTWANVAAPDLGTVRGRIGYAFNQIMPYVTGGWAYGDHDSSGYAIGGGFEYRILPTLSVKAEYLHVELDHPDDIVRAGINFHFNSLGLFSPIGSPIATRY